MPARIYWGTLDGYIYVGSIPSAETLGSPVLAANLTNIEAIAGAETFGMPNVYTSYPITDAGGIASAATIGSPTLAVTVSATAVASAEVLGSPGVSPRVSPNAIASAEVVASPALSAGVSPVGLASGEIIGPPSLAANLTSIGTIDGAEAFGEPTVTPTISLTDAGDITSGEVFGSPSLSALVVPEGIAGGELFGTADVSVWYLISPDGIPGGEEFGEPSVTVPYPIMPYGIWSEEAFGEPIVLEVCRISRTVRNKAREIVVGADVFLFETATKTLVDETTTGPDGIFAFLVPDVETEYFAVIFKDKFVGITSKFLVGC